MRNLPRAFAAIGAIFALIGTLCTAYPFFDKFDGREYRDVGFGGVVAQTPEYEAWTKRNERWSYVGIAFVTIGSVLQIVALYVHNISCRERGIAMTDEEKPKIVRRPP